MIETNTPRRIVLNASNVAGFVNQHPYKPRTEAFMSAWKSSDKTSYFRAHNRNGVKTIEDERREIREASKLIQDDLPPDDLLKVVKNTGYNPDSVHFSSSSADVSARQIAEEARRVAYTSHGDAKENAIIERVNTILNLEFTKDDDAFFKRTIGRTMAGTPIVLQGKIDGMSADGSTILECKARVHKLFLKPRGYELIQTQTYLDLLPGARQALLVEAIFNVGRIPSVNLIDVEREETHTWTPLMYAGADALDRVIRDPALQDAFVNSPRRGAFIKKLVCQSLEQYV